jgi:hypothetical protein
VGVFSACSWYSWCLQTAVNGEFVVCCLFVFSFENLIVRFTDANTFFFFACRSENIKMIGVTLNGDIEK